MNHNALITARTGPLCGFRSLFSLPAPLLAQTTSFVLRKEGLQRVAGRGFASYNYRCSARGNDNVRLNQRSHVLLSRPFSSSTSALERKWVKPKPNKAQRARRTAPGAYNPKDPIKSDWRNYDPETGMDLPSGEVPEAQIQQIFGESMTAEMGNNILALMYYRRRSGALIDVGLGFPPESGITQEDAFKALQFLRGMEPNFNETEAGAEWAEMEVQRLERSYVQRAESLGLYKSDGKEVDEQEQPGSDIYGESQLVAIRKENERKWKEEERLREEKERQEEEEQLRAMQQQAEQSGTADKMTPDSDPATPTPKPNTKARSVAVREPVQKAWLRPVERQPWVKYYEEAATLIKSTTAPEIPLARRLIPTGLLTLAVLALAYFLHANYVPPPKSARMFPDTPPAVATLGALTAAYVAVFVAWRMPPLWRFMNRTFTVAPAYPYTASVFFAQFGHQQVKHLFMNMVYFWPFGLMLHEDVGRGTFLAIALGAGCFGTYSSLVWNAATKQWMTYIFGASTAGWAVIASTCLLRSEQDVKIAGYDTPITGMMILGVLVGLEVLNARFKPLGNVDHAGHFGGMAAGMLAAWVVRREKGGNREGEMMRVEAPKVDVTASEE